MLKLVVLALCLEAVLAAPNVRTKEEIEEYRKYLEKSKESANNGSTLEEAMAENPDASPWENSGKYEGDIVLTDEEIEEMTEDFATGRNAYVRPGRDVRWPGGIVVWAFAANQFTAAQQNQVRNAIAEIQRHTCVRFRGRAANDRNYVLVTGAQTGCYATMGHWSGRHTFNLARGCFNHFIIIHEWLHTVGFNHMHQAFTRDNYIRINWQNIAQSNRFAFDRFAQNRVNMLSLPYEYASNQHYGPRAFSTNGQPTIVTLRANGHMIGQLTHITHWDWLRVRRHYNCPGASNEEVHAEDEGKPEEPLPQYSRRTEPFTDTPVPEIEVDELFNEIHKDPVQPLLEVYVNQELEKQPEKDQQEDSEQPAEIQDQAF